MPITIGRASWARNRGSKHETDQRPVSSPVATEQAPERSGNPRTTRGGGEGRARLGRESSFAHARHHNRTRLNHHRPKTTDTHGRLDGLADRPLLPPPSFVGIPATRLNQHAAKHIQTHTQPTTLWLRPRLPHGTVTSGLPQPGTKGHFRFPDSIWGSRGGTSGSPSLPRFTFVGHDEKVHSPEQ